MDCWTWKQLINYFHDSLVQTNKWVYNPPQKMNKIGHMGRWHIVIAMILHKAPFTTGSMSAIFCPWLKALRVTKVTNWLTIVCTMSWFGREHCWLNSRIMQMHVYDLYYSMFPWYWPCTIPGIWILHTGCALESAYMVEIKHYKSPISIRMQCSWLAK